MSVWEAFKDTLTNFLFHRIFSQLSVDISSFQAVHSLLSAMGECIVSVFEQASILQSRPFFKGDLKKFLSFFLTQRDSNKCYRLYIGAFHKNTSVLPRKMTANN